MAAIALVLGLRSLVFDAIFTGAGY